MQPSALRRREETERASRGVAEAGKGGSVVIVWPAARRAVTVVWSARVQAGVGGTTPGGLLVGARGDDGWAWLLALSSSLLGVANY